MEDEDKYMDVFNITRLIIGVILLYFILYLFWFLYAYFKSAYMSVYAGVLFCFFERWGTNLLNKKNYACGCSLRGYGLMHLRLAPASCANCTCFCFQMDTGPGNTCLAHFTLGLLQCDLHRIYLNTLWKFQLRQNVAA